MPPRPADRLRRLCLALPDTYEQEAHGEPTWRVRGGKMFAMFARPDSHHGAGRPGVWINCQPANQDLLLRADPARYFRPPYVGPRGWIGVWLDAGCDWDALPALLEDGWRLAAPTRKTRAPR